MLPSWRHFGVKNVGGEKEDRWGKQHKGWNHRGRERSNTEGRRKQHGALQGGSNMEGVGGRKKYTAGREANGDRTTWRWAEANKQERESNVELKHP